MDDDTTFDPYATLGVSRSATADEIRRQYRRLALRHHPDKVPSEERDAASTRFQHISRAYEILSDAQRREAWDQTGSTDGFRFEDPREVFRSMWEMLEESGFLQTVTIPTVPDGGWEWGPESELAFRVLGAAVPLAGDVPVGLGATVVEQVSRHLPSWAHDLGGGDWVQQQGRNLGKWADAFLEKVHARSNAGAGTGARAAGSRRRPDPRGMPSAETRRLSMNAPIHDVWIGARRRIRFERKGRDGSAERATCVVPLGLPGVLLQGEGDAGGDLEIRILPTPDARGRWNWIEPFDLAHTLDVDVDHLLRIWREGGTLDVMLPDQTALRVRIPAGTPVQTWRVPGEGFRCPTTHERGDLRLLLLPSTVQGADGKDPKDPAEGRTLDASPWWPIPPPKIDTNNP